MPEPPLPKNLSMRRLLEDSTELAMKLTDLAMADSRSASMVLVALKIATLGAEQSLEDALGPKVMITVRANLAIVDQLIEDGDLKLEAVNFDLLSKGGSA